MKKLQITHLDHELDLVSKFDAKRASIKRDMLRKNYNEKIQVVFVHRKIT